MPKKYIAISEVVRIVKEIRSYYPEDVFPGPTQGGETPASYLAAGTRLTCDNLLARLPSIADEHEYVKEEEEIEGDKKKK